MDLQLTEVTTEADLERLLDVRNAVDWRPVTADGWRAERSSAVVYREILATGDGRDVGAGTVGWGPAGAESGTAFIDVWVRAGDRCQGIGSRIADDLVDFARAHGANRLWASALESDRPSVEFAAHRGLTPDGSGQLGALELDGRAEPDPPALPDGLSLTTVAERPDLMGAIYELEMLVRPEIPTIAHEPNPSLETWLAGTRDDPGFLPTLSPVALDGERVIGAMAIYDNADGVAFIGMTAVHPDARRQGIARAMKTQLTRLGIAGGLHRIETYNDGSNARIRGLNMELGYVYQPTILMLKGPLPTPGSGAADS